MLLGRVPIIIETRGFNDGVLSRCYFIGRVRVRGVEKNNNSK